MTGEAAYREYIAIRNHFNNLDYDYNKYQGKVRINSKSFEARKDKLFFMKLAKHSDVKGFLIANLSKNEKLYIRDLAYSEEAEKVYKDWIKRNQSLMYVVKSDLSKLDENFDKNFIIKDNSYPILLEKYLSSDICLETLCVLLDITKANKLWDKKLVYDPIWEMVRFRVMKYIPFIVYDKDKMKKTIVDFYK